MKKDRLLVLLCFLLFANLSCSKRDAPNPEPIVEAHLVRLAEVLCLHADPTRKNFVLLVEESSDTSLITTEEVDAVENLLTGENGGLTALVLVLGNQDSGTYSVYTWALKDNKLRLDVINYYPQSNTRRSYYWSCE